MLWLPRSTSPSTATPTARSPCAWLRPTEPRSDCHCVSLRGSEPSGGGIRVTGASTPFRIARETFHRLSRPVRERLRCHLADDTRRFGTRLVQDEAEAPGGREERAVA